MEKILFILLIIIIAIQVYSFFASRKKKDTGISENHREIDILTKQMAEMQRNIDGKLGESHRFMSESVANQSEKTQRLITEINKGMSDQLMGVQKSIAENQEASKQIFGLATSLDDLQKVLKHQKQRGNLGEASLKLILENYLPPGTFEMEHVFPDGDTVDALILASEGSIPIDAKFSLDNYNRLTNEDDERVRAELERDFKNDLKKRIDETAKYIKPKEGTVPYAIMFIPAEGIFYDLLVNEIGSVKVNTRNLIDYALREKKVVIASPTTLTAYIHSILHGFRAHKFEKNAEEIKKNVEQLQKHLKSYEEFHGKIGNSLGTLVNHYTRSNKEFVKIDKDVARITGEKMELELPNVDKPILEE